MENPVRNNNEDSAHNMEQPKYQDEGSAHNIEFKGEELKHRLEDEPGSLGVDLDGTNPGSRSHQMDDGLSGLDFTENAVQENTDDGQSEDIYSRRNADDEHMRIDEEGNELSAEDQA